MALPLQALIGIANAEPIYGGSLAPNSPRPFRIQTCEDAASHHSFPILRAVNWVQLNLAVRVIPRNLTKEALADKFEQV